MPRAVLELISCDVIMTPSTPDTRSVVSPDFLHVMLGLNTPEASQEKLAVSGEITCAVDGGIRMTGAAVV